MRALLVALVVLALAPTAAIAQEESPAPEPVPAATVPPDAADDADDACERGGTDADYTYCADEDCVDSVDDQYAYDVECFPSAGGDDEGGGGGPPPPRALPAAQLPLTGGEPLVIALLGAAFVLLGAGLRPRGAART